MGRFPGANRLVLLLSPAADSQWLGCRRDSRARGLIQHSSLPGCLRLAWLGGEGKLLARGDIDAHRRIEVAGGVAIDAWVIRARNVSHERPRGTVLLVHGLWDSKARMYKPGQRLADRGFDVVLPDLRAHGRSGGTCSTFGALEAGDLKTVMDGR